MDITVVLNAHREGVLANATCNSAEAAAAAAEKQGIQVELLAVLDRPNAETREFFAERKAGKWRVAEVDFGDLGTARNEAARLATHRWIAFLDADDLFARHWLAHAHRHAMRDNRLVVWHPETNIYFGASRHIFDHIDMESPAFDPLRLMCENYWTSLCFAPKSLISQVPYRKICIDCQIGYEDWTWNQEVIAHGAIHKIVPKTVHFIRQKNDGLKRAAAMVNCVPAPTEYFRQMLPAT